MKKKLFFVLLLSGSMFLNFNIADAIGILYVWLFSYRRRNFNRFI